MCGIVGCFIKNHRLRSQLGQMLSEMLVVMTDRGPDSAGFAIYGEDAPDKVKMTVQSGSPDTDFACLQTNIKEHFGNKVQMIRKSTHAVLELPEVEVANMREMLSLHHPGMRVMGVGRSMEIYKEVGLPEQVSQQFDLPSMHGSHGIGHTRMATESAVTTLGAHPFSTGDDQCLVHNGSLSNHNNLRRYLRKQGMTFATENDTEVAASYLSYRLQLGNSLGSALENTLDDVDGFYTFVVGTHNGFGVLRDRVACKPAVMAETDGYVAFGSEYRALAVLPDIEKAKVWEPEPATVYFWER